ncbi:NINE protein [Citricoccus nitrophenolicus]|uniref:NINE protein n=1 Tax=Citricoccus nitrophenolicus TaxID=863575 RepID=UPI0031E50816
MARTPKNLLIAYVLCLLLGLLGAHQWYLGNHTAGAVYLILTVAGVASASWGIGFVFGGIVILLCLIDLLLLPGRVRQANGGLN